MRSPPKRGRQRPSLTDDLILEILVRLPAKSVGRFRCVSKRWLSHLTDPNFIRAHSSRSPTSGIFLFATTLNRREHIPLDSQSRLPDPTLSFLDNDGLPPQFLDCCNGLVLCGKPYLYRYWKGDDIYALAVCNPLTRACHFIPVPDRVYSKQVFLAFDPSVSPHFKVVSVRGGVAAKRGNTFIYSSETRRWKLPTKNLRIDSNSIRFRGSTLWNGNLVWNSFQASLLCLDMSRQQLTWLPRPVKVNGKKLWCMYLGESGGRLHFIGKPVTVTHFDIWELMSGSTEWSVLYEVDIDHIKDAYPEANAHPEDQPNHGLAIEIVHFSRDEGGVGDRLLLCVPGKIVYYYLRDKSFTTVCNCPPFEGHIAVNSRRYFFHLAHTLSPLYDNVNVPTSHEDGICWPPDDAIVTRSGRRYPRRMNHATMWFEK